MMVTQSELDAVKRILLKKYRPEEYQALLDQEREEQEERIRLLKSKYEQEVRQDKQKAEEMSLSELVKHLNDNKPSSLTKSKRQWIELSTKRTIK
ncbi:hypothetical protein [Azotobacter chroococcum]|uniref:hypothetical protein n=1 Tax=Azotobacter chroococcum TaxID=353 RepID=UPI0011859646|nr:hypothetical protein [Azotobacter chroococcum]